jgi:hypothetical protein
MDSIDFSGVIQYNADKNLVISRDVDMVMHMRITMNSANKADEIFAKTIGKFRMKMTAMKQTDSTKDE